MRGHEKDVTSAVFSPDGKRIVSTSADDTLRLWNAATGEQIGQPMTGHQDEVTSAAFSPDGKRIVSGSVDKTLRVWDAANGKPLERFRIHRHADRVNSVAFSPNGRFIVSASNDKTVRLWDAATGEPIGGPLEGHTQGVTSAAFSPDGTRIASASADATLRIWTHYIPLDRAAAVAEANRLCPLNADEQDEFSLVDPMSREPLPEHTADQVRACGAEPETAPGH